MAEVAIDATNAALGIRQDFGSDVPPGSLAIEVAPNLMEDRAVREMFRTFGRGERSSRCDCDRADGPTIRQTLYMLSDDRLMGALYSGRLHRLLKQRKSDGEIIEECFLGSLSRFPTADELAFLRQHVAAGPSREEGLADILWGLINSREFITNH